MTCPRCGSHNVHTINNTLVSKNNFNGCLACIGVLLFNIPGLLCGLCGGSQSVIRSDENVCQDCGARFNYE